MKLSKLQKQNLSLEQNNQVIWEEKKQMFQQGAINIVNLLLHLMAPKEGEMEREDFFKNTKLCPKSFKLCISWFKYFNIKQDNYICK